MALSHESRNLTQPPPANS